MFIPVRWRCAAKPWSSYDPAHLCTLLDGLHADAAQEDTQALLHRREEFRSRHPGGLCQILAGMYLET